MDETKDKINSVKYISLKEASKLCSYSQDYLSLRARQGKLKAIKKGRNWVTAKEWVKEYIEQVEDFNKTFTKASKPLVNEATKKNLREIKEILKDDLLIVPNLLKAGYIKLKGVELDFNEIISFFKNLIIQSRRLADKAPVFINKSALWLKQAEKAGNKGLAFPSKFLLNNKFPRAFFGKARPFIETLRCNAAKLLKNLETRRKELALSAFLIILTLLSSTFLFSGNARVNLAKWTNESINTLVNAGENIANSIYRQGENIFIATGNIGSSIENTGKTIIISSVDAVSQAPQFIEETTQNIKEIPFLIGSTAQRGIPILKNRVKEATNGLQKGIKSISTAIKRTPGKIISFARDSKDTFSRASQRNEKFKFALKSNLKQGFVGFSSFCHTAPDMVSSISVTLREDWIPAFAGMTEKMMGMTEEATITAKTLPRQIVQWGITQKIQGKEFFVDLSFFASNIPSATSKKTADAYFFLSDMANDLSDTLSDTPENVVNKTRNAFLPAQKSLNKKRISLLSKLNKAQFITGLTLDEIENIVIARPATAIKTDFRTLNKTTANIFDSISRFGEKTVQISKNIKNKLGDAYIKVAEFIIPGYALEDRGQLLPQKTTITEEPIIQEIIKQVQQITPKVITKEITKEKIIEITETVQPASPADGQGGSADLTEINQNIDGLSSRITNLANQISSRIDYTTPSYAPVYIPSSGLQVAGHALLTTLNVSGSGSIGGSLSVGGNAGFGSPTVYTDTFDVYSAATFSEAATFDSSVSAASLGVSGDLTISGDGTIAGALSSATTTITGDFTVQDSDSNAHFYVENNTGNIGIGTTSPEAVLEVNGDFRVGEGANYNGFFVDATGGNVGIGTAAPSYKLDVNGGIHGEEIRFSPRKQRALVTFVFDDGHDTDYTVMKPVFDAQGEVACSAVISSSVDTGGILSANQLITMQNDGWEIVSHSKTHPLLTTLTETQIRTELSDSKEAFEAMGLTIKNFVYPSGDEDTIVRRIAREYYRAARDTGNGVNPYILETYALGAYNIDNHASLTTYQGYVDTAESGENWLILYMHQTDSDDATTMNSLIDYIQAKDISIVTMDQALDLIGNMIDIGDNFAIGEKGIRIDGNVGIGTANPLDKLQVGDNSASDIFLTFQTSDNNERGINYYLSNGTTIRGYVKWDTAEDLLIKGDNIVFTTDNIGINVATPLAELQLGSSDSSPKFRVSFNSDTNPTDNYYEVSHYGTSGGQDSLGGVQFLSHKTGNSNAYYDFTTQLIAGSVVSRMVIDNNGNVGIGTTTPINKLTIYDTADLGLGFSGASGDAYKWTMGIDMTDAGKFKISSSTALGTNDRFVIDGSGNVGIGTDSPTNLLHVFGNNHPAIGISNPGVTNWVLGLDTDSSDKLLIGSATTVGNNNVMTLYRSDLGGNVGIGTTTPDAALAVTASAGSLTGDDFLFQVASTTNSTITNNLVVTADGNVGIGTGAPGAKLEVAAGTDEGILVSNANPQAVFYKLQNSVESWQMQIRSFGNFVIADGSFDLPIEIEPNANKNLYLDSSGNVGIGTTTPGSWLGEKLAVEGTGSILRASGGTERLFTVGTTTDTDIFVVDSSGNVGIGTSSPDALLDIWESAPGDSDVMFKIASTTGTGFKILAKGEALSDYAFNSGGADYAEYFWTRDTDLEAGEVVCVDITRDNAVKRCARAADGNVMGIVSTHPAIIGNANDEYRDNVNYKIIGMLGQVEAKVSLENGEIRPGDSLTSASVPGFVMRAEAGDSTVGVALEGFGDETTTRVALEAEGQPSSGGTGVINVLISRRNKSLTVETVEEQITGRIAEMEIEDEVNILIAGAIDNLNLEDDISEVVAPELLLINSKLDVTTDDVLGLQLNISALIPEQFEKIDARIEGLEQKAGELTLKLEGAELIRLVEAWDYNSDEGSPRGEGLSSLVLDTKGRFGIATDTPTNILTIGQGRGNAIADGWDVYLPDTDEMEVSYLEESDYARVLDEIVGMEFEGSPRDEGLSSMGLIATSSPAGILSEDGKSVSLYDYTSFAIAGVKALNSRLEDLERFLTVERNENGDLVEIDPLEELRINLAELGLVLDEEGALVVDKIKAKDIETENLKVKGGDGGQAGITLYDRITGEPYCFFVASGVSQTVAGECSAVSEEPVEEDESRSDLLTPTSDEVEESQGQTLEEVIEEEPAEEEVEAPFADDLVAPQEDLGTVPEEEVVEPEEEPIVESVIEEPIVEEIVIKEEPVEEVVEEEPVVEESVVEEIVTVITEEESIE